MGVLRGMYRPTYRQAIWGADTLPIRHGEDFAPEWGGGGDFGQPEPPRFPRRVALVLLWSILIAFVLLCASCATSRSKKSDSPFVVPPPPAPVQH